MSTAEECTWLPYPEDWSAWRNSLPPAPAGLRCTGETAERRFVRSVLALVQDWHCAACLGYFPGPVDLVVDHEHQTDLIRGLLCTRCNISEARSQHPVFVAYRRRPPSQPRIWFYGGYRKGEPPEVYSAATGLAVPRRSPAREAANRQVLAASAELDIVALAIMAPGNDPPGRRQMAAFSLHKLFGATAPAGR